mmetsp:Transcript_20606/g.46482  ORF Transcript_20606/g.46482 Transcript_20606/m.46482 type:complete len:303 (-) Transcript_20606:781-1689(-)
MRRETECFSMYSDMSTRQMLCSSSNSAPASALVNSVFPVPVPPRKRKTPCGRPWPWRPVRLWRMQSATASTVSSWPTTRALSKSSRWSSFSRSPLSSDSTGIPVLIATTSDMSSRVTASLRCVGACCPPPGSATSFSSSGMRPYRSSLAAARSPLRCSRSKLARASSSLALACFTSSSLARSRRQSALSCPSSIFDVSTDSSIWRRRSAELGSVSFLSASSSICFITIFRSSFQMGSGLDCCSILSRDAASSMRSMALSGIRRSVRYRSASVAAATSASSLIVTPWWSSYLSLSPRKMLIVS